MKLTELVLPQYRLCLVDFDDLFYQYIAPTILTDLKTYGLINELRAYKVTRPIKKLFYHHIIKTLCDINLNNKTGNKIVFYRDTDTPFVTNLNVYIEYDETKKLISSILSIITNYLPVRILNSYTAAFVELSYDNHPVLYNNVIADAKNLISSDFKSKTFCRIKDFASRNQLTFLTEQYFNDIKFGQLIFA